MWSWILLAQNQAAEPPWFRDWIPVAVVVGLIFLVPLLTGIMRRVWIGGLKRTSLESRRRVQRIDTLLSFVRSILYFALAVMALFFALGALFPGFDPLAATGAMSIVALLLTGIFRDVVVDVVKGLDILLGGHYDVGDYIEVGGDSGHVIDFQLKYTRLRAQSGEEIIVNNARCVPSKRFAKGYVVNYVDVPLENPGEEQQAKSLIDRANSEVTQSVEAVQDVPQFERTTPMPTTGGARLRYSVRVLPGNDWVIAEVYLPMIRRILDAANITLSGEPSYFYMNDVERFRGLFRRTVSREEIERWATEGDASAQS